MSVFETIGKFWVILTSLLATVGIFYLAYVGLQTLVAQGERAVKVLPVRFGGDGREHEIRVKV